jgi:phospholipase/lecithinase/hemolysin
MKNIIRFAITVFISFAFIALPISSTADSTAFKGFYVFGDSLSDTGNDFKLTQTLGFNVPVPPGVDYYHGRFSNGPVSFEYLWMALTGSNQTPLKPSLGNVNYAKDKAVSFSFGGATTEISNLTPGLFPVDGLVGQVNNFIRIIQSKNIKLHRNTLYALWAGSNDYLLPPSLLSSAVQNPDCSNVAADPVYPVVCNIADAIKKLYVSVGARYFLVPNLGDLGSLPIVNDPVFYNPKLFPENNPSGYFKQLTIAHNSALKAAIEKLKQNYSDIHIVYVDVYSLMDTLIQMFPHGSEAGPAGYCLFDANACSQPLNGFKAPGYVFWDVEHPATGVHGIVAATMITAVESMIEPHLGHTPLSLEQQLQPEDVALD